MTFAVAAEAYDRHVGRYGDELGAALVRAAGVQAGWRVLDIGSGPGALTRALVGLIGPGNVAAVDPSEQFIEALRERLPGVDVRQGSAEELPFADGEFDAALAQLVVNFMRDPETGMREMRRVVRPGGVVAACVWDYPGQMTLLRAFWEAASDVEPELAAPVDARYESFDALWEPFTLGVGPSGAFAVSLGDERRKALRDELRRRLAAPDGPFRLRARAWYAVGTA